MEVATFIAQKTPNDSLLDVTKFIAQKKVNCVRFTVTADVVRLPLLHMLCEGSPVHVVRLPLLHVLCEGSPVHVVRLQVLHTLCDGSPAHLELQVAEALETFNRDADSKIRRQAHKALTSYRKTGKWNIL